jgi:hypothetical protein
MVTTESRLRNGPYAIYSPYGMENDLGYSAEKDRNKFQHS